MRKLGRLNREFLSVFALVRRGVAAVRREDEEGSGKTYCERLVARLGRKLFLRFGNRELLLERLSVGLPVP